MKSTWLFALALAGAMAPVAAAQTVAVEFLLDGEFWKTDDGSLLLARNDGAVAAEGRLRGWLAWRPSQHLEWLLHAMVEGGSAQYGDPDVYLEQLELRALASRALTLEAGKLLQPIGEFGTRRFSNTNPLIGTPDAYPAQYPWAAIAAGRVGPLDYRAGVSSLPSANTRYLPEPDHRLRPVGGLGLNLGPGLRIGAAVSHGPYLRRDVTPQLPPGRTWNEYRQTVVATNLRWSYGYVEARAEGVWSSYDVPTAPQQLHGLGWYGELRGTISPRVFVAGRFEHSRYAFILPINPTFWVARETTQMNGEVGVGYRFSAAALVKTSFRRDHWPVHSITGAPPFPDGYAVAVQFSWQASATDLLASRY